MFSYHLIKGGSLKDIWKVIFSKARFSHELKGRLTSAKEAIKCWEQLLRSYWRDPSDDSPSAILQCGPTDESRAESDLSTLQQLKVKVKVEDLSHNACALPLNWEWWLLLTILMRECDRSSDHHLWLSSDKVSACRQGAISVCPGRNFVSESKKAREQMSLGLIAAPKRKFSQKKFSFWSNPENITSAWGRGGSFVRKRKRN